MTTPIVSAEETPSTPWWVVLLEGIIAILIGLLLLMRPAATMIVLIQFLGFYWLATGIFSLVSLFWDRSAWGWKLFSGILGILAGLLIIQNPLWSTLLVPTTLAIVLGSIGIVFGLMQLVEAFRGGGWGIGVLGVLNILLGLLLITRPVIAGLSLPWVLGFLLIAGGVIALFAAFSLRSTAKREAAQAMQPATRSTAVEPPVEFGEEMKSSVGAAASVGAAEAMSFAETSSPALAAEELAGAVEPAVVAAGKTEEAEVEEISYGVEFSDEELTGNVDPTNPEDIAKFKNSLEFVEGIGAVYAEQLKAAGLQTCLDMLRMGATRKGREDIAEKSGISGKLILKWVNHVDLYRIKGIGSEYADLLEEAGVDTVVELAQRNPANLINTILTVHSEKNLVRKPPTATQVEDWVEQAKGLPRVVTY